ncbi:udp-3-o- n-acetylglucosamine deacetylase [hydrocarbon metagenome]|uniref:UDP-3-O-acyl-N-acetylglucosamine deacetylase n=1 Tax=hydrocarbon metagenome TaxID=938273 RepID=A0A0W8FSU4_9ZZZZ
MNLQRTVKKEISCFSVGLHTGRKINMNIKPAPADTGIVFIRRDLPEAAPIQARYDNVCDTTLATTLGSNGVTVSTVEHLLSAFSGMGVDNAAVELDSFEVPVMDGSAFPFVNMLKEVGTHVQKKNKKLLIIKKPVSVNNGDGSAMFMPSDEFKITYEIDFKHPVIGKQSFDMTFSDEIYEKEICAAQTFGFLKDLEFLQARGLALGGSLKNAIVLDDKKIINKEGQRIENVFVKHKILDAIGDLFLLGMPIIGHFIAYKSGHRLNNLLLRELMSKKECWEIVNCVNKEEAHRLNFFKKIPSFKILDAVQT